MIETISNNCQSFIEYISRSEFHDLAYVSFAIVFFFILFISVKAFLIHRNSKNTINKLRLSTKYSKSFKFVVEELDLKGKVVVFKSKNLSAFCYGIKNPKIYISSFMLETSSAGELKAVLRHEQYHLIKKDSITLFLLHLMQFMFGLLPGFSRIAQNFYITREIKADRYATSYLRDKRPLLSVIKKILEEPQNNFAVVPSIGRYDTLEPRIYVLIKGDYSLSRISVFHVMLSTLLILTLFFALILPVYAHEAHNSPSNSSLLCPGSSTQNVSRPYTPVN